MVGAPLRSAITSRRLIRNEPVPPDQLQKALGPDVIDQLQQQTGMSRDQLMAELSRILPQVVDKLTPEGRMPTKKEAAHCKGGPSNRSARLRVRLKRGYGLRAETCAHASTVNHASS